MSLPFEIIDVPDEVNEELLASFSAEKERYVHAGKEKYLLTPKYREQASGIYNLELKPDDLWIVTFPRSGTTWTQELLWLLNMDLDFERAKKETLFQRFPFIDGSILTSENFKNQIVKINKMSPEEEEEYRKSFVPIYETVAKMASPRHIKTHLPISLLPSKLLDTCKVVYVARNPKDVAVSCFYQNSYLKFLGFEGTFEDYWHLFQRDRVLWAPFWSHVEEGWRLRNHPNLHFIFYEDMKKDLPGVIRNVAAFLNKTLNEEQIAKLVEHLNIEKFRNNPVFTGISKNMKGCFNKNMPGHIRQGKSGTWRNEFSAELNAKADEWIKEHEKKTDLRFQF